MPNMFIDCATNQAEVMVAGNLIASVEIAQHNRHVCFNYNISDDESLEETEYAILTLGIHDSTVCTIVGKSSNHTTINIVDDDCKYIRICTLIIKC